MTGKILGSGVIKAEDGNRYNYDESELKNAKLNQKLDGLEVDFEVQEGKAVGVFITSKQSSFQFSSVDTSSLQNMNLPNLDNQWVFLDLNEAKANLLMPNIHSVKFYALLATFIAFIPLLVSGIGKSSFLESVVQFFVFVLFSWVFYSLYKLSNDDKIIKYYGILIVLSVIVMQFVSPIVEIVNMMTTNIVGAFMGGVVIEKFIAEPPYFKMTMALLCLIGIFVFLPLFFKTLKRITNEGLFMWSFILMMMALFLVFALVLCVLVVLIAKSQLPQWFSSIQDTATILGNLSKVVFVVGWLRFREICVKE